MTGWIDLPTAAKRSGKSRGHLARECRSRWQGMQLAKLEQPADGGKPTWYIREDADAALAQVKFPEQLGADLRQFTAAQREEASRRHKILHAWDEHCAMALKLGFDRVAATHHYVERLTLEKNERVSVRTLYNWHNAYRASGLPGLVDGRGRVSPEIAADSPFIEEVKRLYLRQSCPKLKTCYEHALLVAEDRGWEICSLKTAERRIKQMPAQVLVKMRMGPTAYANQVLPPATRDYSSIASNDWWCSDHHQFDVIIKDEEGKLCRPWLTAWEDLRSRKIVGWHLFSGDPNVSTVLLSFRAGCLAEGIPKIALIDNGREYDSYSLQGETKMMRKKRIRVDFDADAPAQGGILGTLDIKVVHAIAYNAKAKPVERFFNTLCGRFSKFFDTYCGRTPLEKPEQLAEQLAKGKAPSIAEFAERFLVWVDVDYNGRVHEGDSMEDLTPTQAFDRFLVSRRIARADELQLMIQKTSQPLKAGREGVQWGGVGYGKGDPALFPYFNKQIFLRIDPDDITTAAAYTMQDVWIADLEANKDLPFGASESEFRRAAKERKQINDLTNQYRRLGPRQNADAIELMAIKREEQRALPAPGHGPDGDPPPHSIVPVRTALEGQSIPLRKAVGAESMSPRKPKIIDLLAAADDLELPEQSMGGGLKLYVDGDS